MRIQEIRPSLPVISFPEGGKPDWEGMKSVFHPAESCEDQRESNTTSAALVVTQSLRRQSAD